MFQSRITCRQRQEYIRLLETDPEAAANYKIRFDRTDQWFLDEVKKAFDAHDPSLGPKLVWGDGDRECQIEDDLANGVYRSK